MLTAKENDFLQEAIAASQKAHELYGVLVSGQVVQAVLETGWGQKIPENNCFGIKYHHCPYVMTYQDFLTHEYAKGKDIPEYLMFAGYKNIKNCFCCHALILEKNFPNAFEATNIQDYLKFLMKDPTTGLSYATDPNYAKICLEIYNSHGINKLDN